MFEKILFGIICLSGIILLVNRYVLGNKFDKKNPVPESIPVDYARSLFPVLLIVFLLRGFVAEPFRIPSSSMLPTLEIGDFLFVNKFKYGVRLPITHKKIIDVSDPERGDIFVFRYPDNPSQNYIKRVMGVPGDKIEYGNKRLFINGKEVEMEQQEDYSFLDAGLTKHLTAQLQATLDNGMKHQVLINPSRGSAYGSWVVPEGHYFAMGDNRDHSADSRSWGFVPEENIVGKAFFIWMHYDSVSKRGFNFSRIGHSIY